MLLKSILRVTAPVLTAVAAAYILYPPVAAVKKRVKSRRLACVLVFALIFAPLLAVLLYAFCSLRSEGGGSAAEGLLMYINMFTRRINSACFRLCELSDRAGCKFIRHYLDEMVRGTQLPAAELVKRLSSALLDIMLGMVMAFYLLTDEDAAEEARRVAGVLLPKRVYSGLARICGDIDAVFSGYIRGQLTDSLIMCVLITVVLWLVGIPFAPFIGVVSGIANLVPYFGSLLALALTVLSAVLSGEGLRVWYGAAAVIAVQQLDALVISPKIVGKRVRITPFGVIAALSVGGRLFGLWGMVLAVPLCAVAKLLILRKYYRQRA